MLDKVVPPQSLRHRHAQKATGCFMGGGRGLKSGAHSLVIVNMNSVHASLATMGRLSLTATAGKSIILRKVSNRF